jgi:hypothetical protein
MLSKLFGAALVVALVASCSGGSQHPITVSSRAVTAAAPATAPASLDLGNGISLDRIRMVVRTVEAEPASCTPATDTGGTTGGGAAALTTGATAPIVAHADGTTDGGDADVDDDGCGVLRGPALVDLSGADLVAGKLTWTSTLAFPDGTYGNVEFKINTIPAGKATSDAMREMAALHASIAVDGTVDGQSFRFTVPWEVEQAQAGPFTVGPTATPNMTLSFDPSGWFGTASARLDPRDSTNQGAIFAAIRDSIRTFHDDDHDGCDDDHATGCTPAP